MSKQEQLEHILNKMGEAQSPIQPGKFFTVQGSEIQEMKEERPELLEELEKLKKEWEADENIPEFDPKQVKEIILEPKKFEDLSPEEQKRVAKITEKAIPILERMPALKQKQQQARVQEDKPVAPESDNNEDFPSLSDFVGETSDADSDETAETEVGSSTKLTQERCPYCSFDLSKPDLVPEVSAEDKFNFVKAVCGGRFEKTYQMLDGQIEVTFRDLTLEERDECFQAANRLAIEMAEDTNAWSQDILASNQLEIRSRLEFALQIVRFSAPEAGIAVEFPTSRNEFFVDDARSELASLTSIRDYVMDSCVKSETAYRLLISKLGDFRRLLERLRWLSSNDKNF